MSPEAGSQAEISYVAKPPTEAEIGNWQGIAAEPQEGGWQITFAILPSDLQERLKTDDTYYPPDAVVDAYLRDRGIGLSDAVRSQVYADFVESLAASGIDPDNPDLKFRDLAFGFLGTRLEHSFTPATQSVAVPETEDTELTGLRSTARDVVLREAEALGVNPDQAFRLWQHQAETVVGRFYQRSELKTLNPEEEAEIRKLIGDLQVAYTTVPQETTDQANRRISPAMDLERRLEDSLGLGADEKIEAMKEESNTYGHLKSHVGYLIDNILTAYQEGSPQRLFPDSGTLQDKFDGMASVNPDSSSRNGQPREDFLRVVHQTANDEITRAKLDQYYQQSVSANGRFSELIADPTAQNNIGAIREGLINKNRSMLEHYEALNYSARKIIHFMLDAAKKAGVTVQIEPYWLAPYLVRQDFLSRVRLPDPDKIAAAANLFEQLRSARSRPEAEPEDKKSKDALVRSLEEQIGQILGLEDDERIETIDLERKNSQVLDQTSGSGIIDRLLASEGIDPSQLFPHQTDLQIAFQQFAEAKNFFEQDRNIYLNGQSYSRAGSAFTAALRKALDIDFANNSGLSHAGDTAKSDFDRLIGNPAASAKELTLAFIMRNKLRVNYIRSNSNLYRKEAQYLFDSAVRVGIPLPHHTVLSLANQGILVPAEMLQVAQEALAEQKRAFDLARYRRDMWWLTPEVKEELRGLFDQLLRGKPRRLRTRWLGIQKRFGSEDVQREREQLEIQISRLLRLLPYESTENLLRVKKDLQIQFDLESAQSEQQKLLAQVFLSDTVPGDLRKKFLDYRQAAMAKQSQASDLLTELRELIEEKAGIKPDLDELSKLRKEYEDESIVFSQLMHSVKTKDEDLIDSFRARNRKANAVLVRENHINSKWNTYMSQLAQNAGLNLYLNFDKKRKVHRYVLSKS